MGTRQFFASLCLQCGEKLLSAGGGDTTTTANVKSRIKSPVLCCIGKNTSIQLDLKDGENTKKGEEEQVDAAQEGRTTEVDDTATKGGRKIAQNILSIWKSGRSSKQSTPTTRISEFITFSSSTQGNKSETNPRVFEQTALIHGSPSSETKAVSTSKDFSSLSEN